MVSMKDKASQVILISFLFVFCSFIHTAFSQATKNSRVYPEIKKAEGKKEVKYFKGLEVLTGYGLAKLKSQQGNYQVIPLFIGFDYDLKPLVNKKYLTLPGLFQFVLEPFVSYVSSPNNNMEMGSNFLLKVGFLPETYRFQPYFKGGLGFLYMSQHTREQGSQFNFNEYAGLGAHFFLTKDLAFTFEYRFRHISNADIDKPNKGINTNFCIFGINKRF